jgi:hypothetical protein
MSFDLDPVMLEFRGTVYDIFASVNDEHPDQIDCVRIVRRCDRTEVDPNKTFDNDEDRMYMQALKDKAMALGRAQLSEVEYCGGEWDSMIDHADTRH